MEDYEGDDVLAELARLCDELGLDHMDSEAMACETHIFVDTNGNPHECWEAGPGHINVTVAMTPEQAVRITDVMTESAKLREMLAEDNEELAKMRRVIDYLYSFAKTCGVDAGDMRELGVEVDG